MLTQLSVYMNDRLIGIDFGLSKVGLSISDPLKIISIPLKVIKYKKREELLSKLQEIAMENDVKSFVIGYPLNMNNKKNEMTKLVDDFFEELKNLNFNVLLPFAIGMLAALILMPRLINKAYKKFGKSVLVFFGGLILTAGLAHFL